MTSACCHHMPCKHANFQCHGNALKPVYCVQVLGSATTSQRRRSGLSRSQGSPAVFVSSRMRKLATQAWPRTFVCSTHQAHRRCHGCRARTANRNMRKRGTCGAGDTSAAFRDGRVCGCMWERLTCAQLRRTRAPRSRVSRDTRSSARVAASGHAGGALCASTSCALTKLQRCTCTA